MSKRTLITSALPYANGSIHLGHLVEYIQTDILVRFLKLTGREAYYMCADDTHGTPIELNARKQGLTPEELIARYHEEHQKDFADFHIEFDHYYSTHSPENKKHAEFIYKALKEGGHILTKEIEQLYCEHDKRFLPDRFIRGICPHCKAPDQYGDVCENCKRTYTPSDLIEPKCALCGNTPVLKKSEHYFVKLYDFADFLKEWVSKEGRLQDSTRSFVETWLKEGLKDWDISRDGPYFGFPIPDTEDKFFYVWLDAPIGYISTTEHFAKEKGLSFDDFWHSDETEIIHVIGKDIVYFHTLFWPAMLKGAGYTLPSRVIVHGMLTVEGTKMSKTRGTFINARTYLNHLDPQYLRFYYASKLAGNDEDIDLNFEDFTNRVNADFVNKIVNLASRAIPFVHKHFGGTLGELPTDEAATTLIEEIRQLIPKIREHYESLAFHHAVRDICAIADLANKYFQDSAPWTSLKSDPDRALAICTLAVNCTRSVAALLKPVLPRYAQDIEHILNIEPLTFDDASDFSLTKHQLNPFKRLAERVQPKAIEKIIEESKKTFGQAQEEETQEEEREEIAPTINFDEFTKVDLRVALIEEAKLVKGAKKLIQLTLYIGNGERRNVFAGIRASFPNPEVLVGKQIAMVANLAPRKMRFGMSEGMVLATGPSDDKLSLAEVPPPARPGDRIS